MLNITGKKLNRIIFTLMSVSLISCSTNIFTKLAPKKFSLIESNPSMAEVITAKGDILGNTPLKMEGGELIKYAKDGYVALIVKKSGYIPREIVVPANGIDMYSVNLTSLNPNHFEKWVLKTYGSETNEMLRKLLQIQGLLFLKKFNLAEGRISIFQKSYPNIASSYTMLGNIYYHQEKFKEARAQLLRALSIDSKDETTIRFLKAVNKKLIKL